MCRFRLGTQALLDQLQVEALLVLQGAETERIDCRERHSICQRTTQTSVCHQLIGMPLCAQNTVPDVYLGVGSVSRLVLVRGSQAIEN